MPFTTCCLQVRVQCPELEGYPKVQGQLLEVEVATLRNSVGDFKQRLSDVLDLPASKQNLSRPEVGFMRNELSLAHYNVGPEVVLTLGIRERGGRKK
jgi:splicing factor 3A subunit 1